MDIVLGRACMQHGRVPLLRLHLVAMELAGAPYEFRSRDGRRSV